VGAVKVRVHRALQQLREIFLQLEKGTARDLNRAVGDSAPLVVPPRRLQ
jgi:hypothetical protein